MEKEKRVCFAGPRYDWKIIGIEKRLEEVIDKLISLGFNVFYDGNKGAFDSLCARIVLKKKRENPNIKLIRVLSSYGPNREKYSLPLGFDESVYPDLENCYPKARITRRNEWIVESSDILVCHIFETYKSGAFMMLKYAKKVGKEYILL